MTRVDQQMTSRGTEAYLNAADLSLTASCALRILTTCPGDYVNLKNWDLKLFNHINMLSFKQLLSGWQRKQDGVLFICFGFSFSLGLFVCVQWNCQFWEKLWEKQNLLLQMEGWTPACQRGCGSKNMRKKQEGAQGAGGRGGRRWHGQGGQA